MRQKSGTQKASAEQVVKDIRRATRKQYGAEEKIRIVLEGLRGEENISQLSPSKSLDLPQPHAPTHMARQGFRITLVEGGSVGRVTR